MTPASKARARALKVKFKELIGAIGGIEEAERLCRVGKTTLARYYSLQDEHADMFAPIDVVRDLEEVAGDPIVTSYLATESAHVLVARRTLSGVTIGNLHTAIARCAREYGDAHAALFTALADGKICEVDAVEVLRELDEFAGEIATLRAMVAATQGEIEA